MGVGDGLLSRRDSLRGLAVARLRRQAHCSSYGITASSQDPGRGCQQSSFFRRFMVAVLLHAQHRAAGIIVAWLTQGERRYLHENTNNASSEIRRQTATACRLVVLLLPLTQCARCGTLRAMTLPTANIDTVVRLRGHHLLCLFGYQGMGYSEEFIAGMSAVVRRLRQPDTRVEIVAGPDDICAACPKRENERCRRSTEHARDNAVLAAVKLPIGHIDNAAVLFATVAACITPERQAILCDGCSWQALGLCAEGLRQGVIARTWEDNNGK